MQNDTKNFPDSALRGARASGFTLLEMMVVVAIIGIAAVLAVPNINAMMRASRATTAARDMADLISIARSEAIRDGVNQVVIFNVGGLASVSGMPTSGGGNLNHPATGQELMAMRFRDANGDGVPNGGEVRSGVPFNPELVFGANNVGGVAAPHDAGDSSNFATQGITFVDAAGDDDWIGFMFTPDGLPRSFKVNGSGSAATIGGVGTGGGAVYFELADPPRTYAVQVSAGGALVVSRFGGGEWK